jgi:peptide/nickel transport system ATP-binding protein
MTISPEQVTAAEGVAAATRRPAGRLGLTLRRFARNRTALAGGIVVVLLFVLAFAGPYLLPSSYHDIDYEALYEGPSATHWWGTDPIGHDVLAQCLHGLQKSLLIGLLVALFSTVLSSLVGACAGYFGRWTDRALMFVVDLMLVFPSFLIIAIVSPRLREAGWLVLVAMIALFNWMITARVVRSMTLSLKQEDFVRAARLMGVRPFRVIARHIVPNVASFLIIDATVSVSAAVLSETALSYFGFGVQPPDVSLGTLIAAGTPAALSYPWVFFFPSVLLIVFVLAVNLMGDGLRDALDAGSSVIHAAEPRRTAAPRPADTAQDDAEDAVLQIRDLSVSFPGPAGPVQVVRGVDLTLRRGEVLGLVGESGSGKSMSVLAAMGLLPANARAEGSIRLAGTEIVGVSDGALSRLRGNRIAMVFQDPLAALAPFYTVGDQIAETIRIHRGLSGERAHARAVELLDLVGIPEPARRAGSFPHEFSGGMRQRVLIAMAIANEPDVILADEPTTALDVTVQEQILDVLRTAQRETGAAMVFVSHDLAVVAGFADRVAVMYAGRIVEIAPVDDLFARPRMPYTLGLLGAVPRVDGGSALAPIPGAPPAISAVPAGCPFAPRCPLADDRCRTAEPPLAGDGHRAACWKTGEITEHRLGPADLFPMPEPPPVRATGPRRNRAVVLRASALAKTFPLYRGAAFRARTGTAYVLNGVDLDVRRGETVGLVGESGAGKTTMLMEILGLRRPESGELTVLGARAELLSRADRLRHRGRMQIVFQDPFASLDPRMPVGDIIAEPLRAQGAGRDAIDRRIPELLRLVGLEAGHAARFPHEFSGGQRQRIAIARALSTEPELLILDEPVSALDVSVQAGVLNLLAELRAELSLAYLLVSHDLAVIRHIADRVSVMYLGRIVETGGVEEVFGDPRHPYTQALLSAVPVPDPARARERTRILLPGDPPDATERVPGCRFRGRCPLYATLPADHRRRCESESPALTPVAGDHVAACHWT